MTQAPTIKELEAQGRTVRRYSNGVYGFRDGFGYCHLVIDRVDVLKGKDAICFRYYGCGSYTYKTHDGRSRWVHRKIKQLTKAQTDDAVDFTEEQIEGRKK